MKLLSGPFGWDCPEAAHLQLTQISASIDESRVGGALKEFGCPPQIVPTVLNSLRNCGRYDCYLQATWVKSQHRNAIDYFLGLGLRFHIDHWLFFGEEKYT